MKVLRFAVLCFFPIVLAGLAAVGCKKEPPVVPEATIALTAIDASCTEAWLKATTTQVPATVRLLRLTPTLQTLQTLKLTTSDSLLIDEGLLPKQTYTYQLQTLSADSSVLKTSASVQVATMDTTSHNFTWQIDTLGATSSSLYDVAIISENNVWVVGELYLRDSSGLVDPILYNAAHWDGMRWQPIRIYSDCRLYWPNCGPVYFTVSPGRAVFALGPDDIWLVAGGVHHFNGISWTERRAMVEIGGTSKIWGNSDGVYFVGANGMILHYNGSPNGTGTWRRVESGTTLAIRDIWGARNPRTGEL